MGDNNVTEKQKQKDKEVQDIIKRLDQEFSEEQSEADETAEEGIKLICNKLRAEGINTVDISFSGCGDDGSINEISSEGQENLALRQEIEDWAYDVLDGTGVDWYNNEGGYGTITINVKKGNYKFEVSG